MQRLANGNTVIADNGRMKVIEIDKDKKVVWEFDVPNDNKRKTPTMRQVRRLDNGNTLICASTEDKVLEVSPEKKVVWSYEVPFPYLATRLANGNTLISSGDGYGSPRGFFVVEVDKDGKEVWKYGGADAPEEQQLKWPSGHVRLANGNTLIAEARGSAIREVSPEKKTSASSAVRDEASGDDRGGGGVVFGVWCLVFGEWNNQSHQRSGEWVSMKQTEVDKLVNATVKESAKAHKWKFSRGFVFKATELLFFSIPIFGQAKHHCLFYSLSFKMLAFDDLFWTIVNLDENSKQPLSFRAMGAWTAPATTISEGEVSIEEWEPGKLRVEVNAVLDRCELDAQKTCNEVQGTG